MNKRSESDGGEDSRVLDYLNANTSRIIAELSEWIRVPSVAGLPEREQNLMQSANLLAAACREIGFPVAELLPTGPTVAVYAEWCEAPKAPTVLVYSHHDVRAVKDERWDQTEPFIPARRQGRLYGRGSSDAKGQLVAHLWGVRAHLEGAGRAAPAVNLKWLIEGEEEMGSPNLATLLEHHRDRLRCDVVVFSDTLQWRADHPAICTSVRGMISAHLDVRGPARDVHSGAVSGPAPNPIHELSRLIGQLEDADGRVTLPGFYDDVPELSTRRRAELAALPFSDEDWLERSQTRSIGGEAGYTVLERLWARPSVEVTSILAGDPVGTSRAAVPAIASADVSIRFVVGQTAGVVAEQLRTWVAEKLPDTVDYELAVAEETAQEPYETPDHPAVQALERAIGRANGGALAGRMGNAGGGPAELLASTLDAPVVFFGTGLPEDHWHDSDESVRIDVLVAGAATIAFLWSELATVAVAPA